MEKLYTVSKYKPGVTVAQIITVEVRNRLKGLDLIDRVPDELGMEISDIAQERGSKTTPPKKKFKKQNGCLRRLYN